MTFQYWILIHFQHNPAPPPGGPSIAGEQLGVTPAAIEAILAHRISANFGRHRE
jgi:hypothetical protein